MERKIKYIETLKKKILSFNCPEENKQAILKFIGRCEVQGLKPSTIYSYLKQLHLLAKCIKKPFSQINEDDIIFFFTSLKENGYAFSNNSGNFNGFYSDRTIELCKVVVKKFLKFLNGGNLPLCASCLKSNRKNSLKLPEEILTRDEIKKILEVCDNQRDVALISVLYESGCRIGELLNMRIKDVTFDQYGSVIVVDGKTGQRRLRLIESEPALRDWINHHPDKDNPEASLWISYKEHGKALERSGVIKRIKRLAKIAGIKKNVYPHLFRHSRLTHLAEDFTESDLRIWAGWGRSSKMPEIYIHRAGGDVEDKYLRLHGIEKDGKKEDIALKQRICVRCGERNPSIFKFCSRCGTALVSNPLDAENLRKEMEELERRKEASDEWMNRLIELPDVKEFLARKLKELISQEGSQT
jgi:site-specific recombinase XerD/ribosomal protein L40E